MYILIFHPRSDLTDNGETGRPSFLYKLNPLQKLLPVSISYVKSVERDVLVIAVQCKLTLVSSHG